MKQLILLLTLGSLYVTGTNAAKNLVCYYNSASLMREGVGNLTNSDLETALPFCSHLVYGYVGIRADNYQVQSLNEYVDIRLQQFAKVTALKLKHPHLKVLLSVGGDRDIDVKNPDKYIHLLEGGRTRQAPFIQSVFDMAKNYGFDGIDLAYQFPRNKPRKVHSGLGAIFKSFKKTFTGDFIVDPNATLHKDQFTTLVFDLQQRLSFSGMVLSLTVLPNVNSSWYFDVPVLSRIVDYVNLAAFDFLTPVRNPEEADFTAPLYNPGSQNRLPHYNADFQVKHWLLQGFPAQKLNLGVASYGNAWKLTTDSGKKGTPVVSDTAGPAPEGPYSKQAGLLSYPEICSKLNTRENRLSKDKETPLKEVSHGNYAFRIKRTARTEGIWISYDDINTIEHKAGYADTWLGGVALFELGYDDFRGLCSGAKYPVLRIINHNLRDFTSAIPTQRPPTQTYSVQSNQTERIQIQPNQAQKIQIQTQTYQTPRIPTQAYPPQTYTPPTYPPQTYPPPTYPPPTYAPQTYTPQTYAPPTYPSQTYPPPTYAPQTYPPQTYAPQTYPPPTNSPHTYPPQTYPPPTYAAQTYSPQNFSTYMPISSGLAPFA